MGVKTQMISLVMKTEMVEAMDTECKKTGLTRSEFIRRAVQADLDRQNQTYPGLDPEHSLYTPKNV